MRYLAYTLVSMATVIMTGCGQSNKPQLGTVTPEQRQAMEQAIRKATEEELQRPDYKPTAKGFFQADEERFRK